MVKPTFKPSDPSAPLTKPQQPYKPTGPHPKPQSLNPKPQTQRPYIRLTHEGYEPRTHPPKQTRNRAASAGRSRKKGSSSTRAVLLLGGECGAGVWRRGYGYNKVLQGLRFLEAVESLWVGGSLLKAIGAEGLASSRSGMRGRVMQSFGFRVFSRLRVQRSSRYSTNAREGSMWSFRTWGSRIEGYTGS